MSTSIGNGFDDIRITLIQNSETLENHYIYNYGATDMKFMLKINPFSNEISVPQEEILDNYSEVELYMFNTLVSRLNLEYLIHIKKKDIVYDENLGWNYGDN